MRGRTEPLQCSRCISGAMADDVSIADDVQFCTFESTATRADRLCSPPPPPRTSPAERSARKNEDPQFELRFRWRDLIDSGEFLQSINNRLPPCAMHLSLTPSKQLLVSAKTSSIQPT